MIISVSMSESHHSKIPTTTFFFCFFQIEPKCWRVFLMLWPSWQGRYILLFTNHFKPFLRTVIVLFWCFPHHTLLSRCVWPASLTARRIRRLSGSRATRRLLPRASSASPGRTRAAPSRSAMSVWKIRENTASLCATCTAPRRWMWPWACTSAERRLRRTLWRWVKGWSRTCLHLTQLGG